MGDSCHPNNIADYVRLLVLVGEESQTSEQQDREVVYQEQQKELLEQQRQQRRDLLKSMEQRNKMEADFARRSVLIWREYFKRLSGGDDKQEDA